MRPLSRRSRQLPLAGEPTPQSATPPVRKRTTSPWQGRQWRWLAALFFLPPLLRGGGAGAKRMARWGRVSYNNSGLRPLSQQPLRFASEPPPLDRGGNDGLLDRGANGSVSWQGRQPPQSMRLFTAASIYSHTPRKFLFTSLFGMRRTVKP